MDIHEKVKERELKMKPIEGQNCAPLPMSTSVCHAPYLQKQLQQLFVKNKCKLSIPLEKKLPF